MAEIPSDHPQNPETWVSRALDDLARARTFAVEGSAERENMAMRSAGIASLLAARRTRDRGENLSSLWEDALTYDDEVEHWKELDPLQSDYYREKAIHFALLEAIELEKKR